MIPSEALSDAFLHPGICPSQLGILSIFLGGGVLHKPDVDSALRDGNDWDGLAVVRRKRDILHIMKNMAAELSSLFNIDKLEVPWGCWKDAFNSHVDGEWDVVRFSGFTKDGSKRTVKILSLEHLDRILGDSQPHSFGVLTPKVLRSTETQDPSYGSLLFIHNAVKVTSAIHIMEDADLLEGPVVSSDGFRRSSWPGIICDVLLTSECLYEEERGVGNLVKSRAWSKWLLRNQPSQLADLLPLLFHWARFSPDYQTSLLRIGTRLCALRNGAPSAPTVVGDEDGSSTYRVCATRCPKDDANRTGFRALMIKQLKRNENSHSFRSRSDWKAHLQQRETLQPLSRHLFVSEKEYEFEIVRPSLYSHFSINSQCQQANIRMLAKGHVPHNQWHNVFVKTAASCAAEVEALPCVQAYFPSNAVQEVIAINRQTQQLFYSFFNGKTILDIRLEYFLMKKGGESSLRSLGGDLKFERWLLGVEAQRAQGVMNAYDSSWMLPKKDCPKRQEDMNLPRGIHRFFYHRLHGNRRIDEFYNNGDVEFLRTPSGSRLPLSSFLSLPITINGVSYGSLQSNLNRAETYLHPQAPHFQLLPTAFGLGDGHGGNVMANVPNRQRGAATLRYIDYEVAGFHSPYIDMAKPMYNDNFFAALYADLLADDITDTCSNGTSWKVDWEVSESHIDISYGFKVGFLDKGLAVTKLEYALRPMLEYVGGLGLASEQVQDAERALGYALFCCAVLTRNLSSRADVFFLNLALGLDLVRDMRGVFKNVFDWVNWPCDMRGRLAIVPVSEGRGETLVSSVPGATYLPALGTKYVMKAAKRAEAKYFDIRLGCL
ncbi:hypothetical protein FQN54_009356 [Arachnomyces sp. PD_36]|nr:hypothetical protein FQN54_009356 [Arachnomyces sp. PD_36]